MSDERIAVILDAAYRCFLRHGIRRTSMDDIAAEAGMSRPAVYQYVRNKDDVFRRLAARMFDDARQRVRGAVADRGDLATVLASVLTAKLDLTVPLWHATPHAAELLGEGTRVTADLVATFTTDLRAVLVTVLTAAADRGDIVLPTAGTAGTDEIDAGVLADLLIALTRGLEHDLDDPQLPARRLRQAAALIVGGLTPTTMEETA